MKKFNKVISFALIMMMLVGTLTACGGKDDKAAVGAMVPVSSVGELAA